MKDILNLSEKPFGNNVEEPTDFFWVVSEECPEEWNTSTVRGSFTILKSSLLLFFKVSRLVMKISNVKFHQVAMMA